MLIQGQILNDGLLVLIDRIRQSQRRKNLRRSGRSADSLRPVVAFTADTLRGEIVGSAYWQQQQAGRGPNRSGKPGRAQVEALKKWTAQVGLPEAAAWPIAVRQAKFGITVPNAHNPGGVLSEPLAHDAVTAALAPLFKRSYADSIRQSLFPTKESQ